MANRPLDNGTRIGNYTIVRRISNGGMGMVYLACSENGQPVVIKEYLPHHLNLRKQGQIVHLFNSNEQKAFESGMQDFFNENEMLSKIQHPNVVRVLDSFLLNHTAYSVMEYIYGQSLQHIIQRERYHIGLKESFIQQIFLDVLNGVDWLHKNNIIHLDIKPSNIYITHKGNAILLDFGTAWLLNFNKSEKRKRIPMHTPGFAPPEQHKEYYSPTRIGFQTDIYALGCSMYSCIKGIPPPPSIKRIKGHLTFVQQDLMGLYSPWLLQTIDNMMILEWNRRPKSVEKILNLFETSQAFNQENPVKLQLYSLISRTQNLQKI